MHRDLDEDEEMVSPLQAASLLVDWMDPQKALLVSVSPILIYEF